MNIMTWNILADEYIDKKEYNNLNKKYLNRKIRFKNILKIFTLLMPEIVLFQEVMREEYELLKEKFDKIYIFSKLKYINWGSAGKSGNIILVKHNICNDVKFYYKENHIYMKCLYKHRKLIVINLHLDDIDKNKRKKQINDIIEKINHHLCIIGGDFNEHYSTNSNIFNSLKKNKFDISNKKYNTYFVNKSENIDNICYRGFQLNKFYIDNKIKDSNILIKKYGSDHLPIVVKFYKKEIYLNT